MEAALARYGSPLYVYDADVVRATYARFLAAFPYRPLQIHYAIVCNKNRYLVRLLAGLGAGIHANTPGDAFAALAAGVPAERIVYSGTNLGADDLRFLLGRGIRMNLDSLDQLRDRARLGGPGDRRDVGLRLLIDDEDRPNRIGVAPGELPEALAIAARAGLAITGLHMYAGTNTRRAGRFVDCLDRLLAAAAALPDLAWIDVGGGFGLPYGDGEPELPLETLGWEVSARVARLAEARGREIELVIEPGRYLVGASGSLLVTVVSVKTRGGRRYVGVDSTVGNIVVPSVYHARHRIEVVGPKAARPPLELPTDVCGNTTHSRDFLGRNLRLPALEPGDVLRLCDVGAYGYAMSSHFLNRPRPAEVVLDGGAVHLTTRRETFADLVATQVDAPSEAEAP
ncbi:MAG TPA: hypothetical protein VK932_09135 [Kofleriaceae bacterium]|nr:hypothetical protein [Kofleriaceae bacterium]